MNATDVNTATAQDAARFYLEQGLSVIPIKPREKVPSIPWKDYQSRRLTVADVEQYFSTDSNIAVVTGAISGGLTVIDFDVPELFEQFKKAHPDLSGSLSRTGKGYQAFVRTAPTHSAPAMWNGQHFGDIKSEGGYVLVPPSVHPSGKRYAWLTPWGDLPEIDLADYGITYKVDEGAAFQVKRSANRIKGAAIGTRNSTLNTELFQLSALIAQGTISPEQLIDTITPAALAAGLGPHEIRATVQSAIGAGIQKAHWRPASRAGEIEAALSDRWQYRYNEVNARVEFRPVDSPTWAPLEDRNEAEMRCFLYEAIGDGITREKVSDIINGRLAVTFNPIEEYFSSLPSWDGQDHIKTLAATLKVPGLEAEARRDLYIRRWMIAAVGTALCQVIGDRRCINHTILILVGEQGTGKTSWLNALSPAPELRHTGTVDLRDRDARLLLSTKWIINLDELEGSTRHDWSSLKTSTTADQITQRMAYDRRTSNLPRRASLCASINHDEFLRDESGTRRFLVSEPDQITIPDRAMIDRAWAQAHALLRSGEKYWFDGSEITDINTANEGHRSLSTEEELVALWLAPPKAGQGQFLSASEVCDYLSCKLLSGSIRLNPVAMSRALKARGFNRVKKRHNGTPMHVWHVLKTYREDDPDRPDQVL